MISLLDEFLKFLEDEMYFFSVQEQEWNTELFDTISRQEIIMNFLKNKIEKNK